ncbi:hypothetical protein K438DRAFT_2021016 [Mycena galopus ATCC 62051]|nr:hypothetical protein K438DRAFT_2021016 [Mycena galopus ATCC 62051]
MQQYLYITAGTFPAVLQVPSKHPKADETIGRLGQRMDGKRGWEKEDGSAADGRVVAARVGEAGSSAAEDEWWRRRPSIHLFNYTISLNEPHFASICVEAHRGVPQIRWPFRPIFIQALKIFRPITQWQHTSPTPSLLNVAAQPVATHIRMQPHYLGLNVLRSVVPAPLDLTASGVGRDHTPQMIMISSMFYRPPCSAALPPGPVWIY